MQISYGYNYDYLCTASGGGPTRSSSVQNPAQLLMWADSAKQNTLQSYFLVRFPIPRGTNNISLRHKNGSNLVFVDGHVALHTYDEVMVDGYSSSDPKVKAFWSGGK